MIEVEGLRVAYGRTLALDTLDLVIGPGVTGLFGQNGSGKTTLLRVLGGLLKPTTGTVRMGGVPVDASDESFRQRVGYVGHDSGLYPDLTVVENLDLFARLYGTHPGKVSDVLAAVGLEERARTRVSELSTGLRRRAAVARALVHEPDLLLLDEPYANLDDAASEKVSAAIKAWRGTGRCCVVATHGAKRVKLFADAGLILKQGRVMSYRIRTTDGEPTDVGTVRSGVE
ncbi:MAG: heme ABC exporter ATP-binding protein CcmA [Actinomycetota bacterium]